MPCKTFSLFIFLIFVSYIPLNCGVQVQGSTLIIREVTFVTCSSRVTFVEGKALCELKSAAVPKCPFGRQGDGGTVRAWDEAEVSVADSAFVGSRAGSRGGAISVVGASLLVANTLFANCSAAAEGGGAIAAGDYQCYGASPVSTSVYVQDSTFEDCSAPMGAGGAIAGLASSGDSQPVSLRIFSSSFAR